MKILSVASSVIFSKYSVLSGILPIQSYNWVGPGTIGCTGCDSTTVDDLPPGGTYFFSLDIDGNDYYTTASITELANSSALTISGWYKRAAASARVTFGIGTSSSATLGAYNYDSNTFQEMCFNSYSNCSYFADGNNIFGVNTCRLLCNATTACKRWNKNSITHCRRCRKNESYQF